MILHSVRDKQSPLSMNNIDDDQVPDVKNAYVCKFLFVHITNILLFGYMICLTCKDMIS